MLYDQGCGANRGEDAQWGCDLMVVRFHILFLSYGFCSCSCVGFQISFSCPVIFPLSYTRRYRASHSIRSFGKAFRCRDKRVVLDEEKNVELPISTLCPVHQRIVKRRCGPLLLVATILVVNRLQS